MANLDSILIAKALRHRGEYTGKEQSITGSYRLAAGGAIPVTDVLRLVPLGENVRPISILVGVKKISGTPVLTNPSFSVGVLPLLATTLTRADGTTYPPLTGSATVLGASTALGADELARFPEPAAPTTAPDWGPYIVTLTPSAGTFSVAGGDIDIFVEVVFQGETQEAAQVYSVFNSQKYKNP